MLVLTLQKNKAIIIGEQITLRVLEIRGDKVRLGIEAPRDLPVDRVEVREAKRRERGRHDLYDVSSRS